MSWFANWSDGFDPAYHASFQAHAPLDSVTAIDPLRPVEWYTKPRAIQLSVLIHGILIVSLSPLYLDMRLLKGTFFRLTSL